jgi:hypothetical protein
MPFLYRPYNIVRLLCKSCRQPAEADVGLQIPGLNVLLHILTTRSLLQLILTAVYSVL